MGSSLASLLLLIACGSNATFAPGKPVAKPEVKPSGSGEADKRPAQTQTLPRAPEAGGKTDLTPTTAAAGAQEPVPVIGGAQGPVPVTGSVLLPVGEVDEDPSKIGGIGVCNGVTPGSMEYSWCIDVPGSASGGWNCHAEVLPTLDQVHADFRNVQGLAGTLQVGDIIVPLAGGQVISLMTGAVFASGIGPIPDAARKGCLCGGLNEYIGSSSVDSSL